LNAITDPTAMARNINRDDDTLVRFLNHPKITMANIPAWLDELGGVGKV
jgi:hypothetical protein